MTTQPPSTGGVRATTALTPDRCPGVLALHDAADGALARVRVPGGIISARGLRAIAAVARRGSGVIELTSRASVQVRGLGHQDAGGCAGLLADAGLLPSPAHDRARNILAGPFGGRHPGAVARTDGVVTALDRALCADPALAALPGRFLFAVDDGTHLLGGHTADVVLRAVGPDRFELALRGALTGRCATRRTAPGLALEAARGLLVGGAPDWTPPAPVSPRIPVGILPQGDGHVALTVMPRLARLDPPTAEALAELLERWGGEVRISAERTLTLVDLDPSRAGEVRDALVGMGLIDDPRSGWRGLTACAGLGACRRARLDVRARAQARAAQREPEAPPEHWAACERRCGRPAVPHLANTATPDGVRTEWMQTT